MAKSGKMQKVIMGILATMLVASLVLAVASFVWPAPVHADFCWCATYHCFWVSPFERCCYKYWRCCDVWGQCKWGFYCDYCCGC
jgi:hypothetical protein